MAAQQWLYAQERRSLHGVGGAQTAKLNLLHIGCIRITLRGRGSRLPAEQRRNRGPGAIHETGRRRFGQGGVFGVEIEIRIASDDWVGSRFGVSGGIEQVPPRRRPE